MDRNELLTKVRELSAKATRGPWLYRSYPFDDWGYVRSAASDVDGFHPVVLVARAGHLPSNHDLDRHREEKTDPYGANAQFAALAPDMAAELLRLAEENERLRAALDPFTEVRIERAASWAEAKEPWPDDRILVGYDEWRLTVGMVRAARAALAGQPSTDRDADHG